MKPVYILYPEGEYKRRLKTTRWWKAHLYRLWLWIKHHRPILTDIKRTRGW